MMSHRGIYFPFVLNTFLGVIINELSRKVETIILHNLLASDNGYVSCVVSDGLNGPCVGVDGMLWLLGEPVEVDDMLWWLLLGVPVDVDCMMRWLLLGEPVEVDSMLRWLLLGEPFELDDMMRCLLLGEPFELDDMLW